MSFKKPLLSHTEHKQKGAIMLIVTILVAIFIIIGLIVMEIAMLEQATIRNDQRKNEIYQAAYSEIGAQLKYLAINTSHLKNAITAVQSLTPILNSGSCTAPGEFCQIVNLTFIQETPAPAGYSIGSFKGLLYEINSIASINNSGAKSDQTLSFMFVVPKF